MRNEVITYHLRKRYNNIQSNNFGKLKRIVVIISKQHQRSKEKLTVQRKSTSINECCNFTLQMKRSPNRYTATPKRDKIPVPHKKVY